MAVWESRGESNEWYTPRYIFDALGETFDLDVACPEDGPRYVPAREYYFHDSLSHSWFGFIWMNPPFGDQPNKRRWLTKFFAHGHGIALLPDRTSASWFQQFAPLATSILWVTPKIKFERPDRSIGERPSTGTALFAAGERADAALRRSGLGFISRPIFDPMGLW